MGYLIHCGLITAYSLIFCVLLFCLCILSGFKICTLEKDNNVKDNENEKYAGIYSLISTVFWCSVCFVLAFSLVYLGAILSDNPDKISYGGGGSFMGSSDSEIIFFQSDDGWVMIIPDNYGEPDMNYTAYYTYYWNGIAWILEEEE